MPYKDPEKRRANARAYCEKNRDKISAYLAAWHIEHQADRKEKDRIYREQHRDRYAAYDRARAKQPERIKIWKKAKQKWLAKNPGKPGDYHRKWASKPDIKVKRAAYSLQLKQRKRELLMGRPRPHSCDICGGDKGGIVFDHCHKTNAPRGWICWRCNVVLGLVEDDTRLLTQMIAYLQRTKINISPQFTLPGV